MDAQTVRTALGTIQSNPTDEQAWQALSDTMSDSDGDLDPSEALVLFRAASERHESRGEGEAVARLLSLAVKSAEGSSDEVELVGELATVLLGELFDGRRAIEVLTAAVSRVGGGGPLEARLEELKERAAAAKDQAKTYRSEAENATDDDYRSAMLMRASEAEVCFSKRPAFGKIIENLETSLRLDSGNEPATKLLEVIYRRKGDFEGLVSVLERGSDRSPNPATRVAAGVRLARLYQHHFQDDAKAAAAYDRVLAGEPNHADALAFVTEYYSAAERWDDLVRVYERQLKAAGGESTVGDMLQVAMLHWKMRTSPSEAEPWFEKIAQIQPAHEGVLNFYREYKADLKDDAGLVRILQDARKALPAGDDRASILDGEIEEKEGEQVGAQRLVEKYKSALRVNPDNEEARESLKNLYKQTQGHNALVELLRQELERAPDEDLEQRLSILREIATVYRKYVKSDSALVGVLNQIVNLDGNLDVQDVEEVRELVALYEKLSRPRDHLASLKLLAEIVPDRDEKVSLYRQVGRRWLEQFSNVQHAMEAFAALHELDPSDPEGNERLEDLYRKRRSWKELFVLYEERLANASGEARIPLLSEMAQLASERLNRAEDALGYYRQILELDPGHTEILDRMEKHAERSKSWATLADVLERRMALSDESETRLGILQKLGAVYGEHLEMQEEAVGAWKRVLEVQPGHPRAMRVLRDAYLKTSRFDELETLYTGQNELEGLAEVLSTAADRNSNPKEKLDLSYRAARVYEEGLGQAPRAIRSYERILSVEPEDQRAISLLLPLYEHEEKWARIPPLLEVQVALAEDEEARLSVYELLVDVAGTKLADKKGAVVYARRAFDAGPSNPRALELLDRAVRGAGAWDVMVAALEARIIQLGGNSYSATSAQATPIDKKKRKSRKSRRGAQIESEAKEPEIGQNPSVVDPEVSALSLRLCRVLGEELGRVGEAVVRLKAMAKASPQNVEVMDLLESLFRRDARPEDMRWLFEHRKNHAQEPSDQAEILRAWATFEESVAGNAAGALSHYDEALNLAPDHEATLEAVVRLALSQDQPKRAAEVLEQHRDLLSGEAAAYKDAMLADLLTDRLSRPVEALAAAKRALEGGAEPGSLIPVLQRLVEVPEIRGEAAKILSEQYEAGGDSRQEADAVRALISETPEADVKVELFKKLADIFEEKLSEPGAALSVILEALSGHPEDIALWDRAVPLAHQSGRPTDLSEAFRTAIRLSLPDELCLDLARRAAILHETTLEDPQGAVPYYEKILTIEPDDGPAFSRLRELLTAGERWRELEELYAAEIERLDDDGRSIEMLAEVALLAEDIMGDAARAIAYHKRILKIDPETAVSLEALDRLFTRTDKKEELLQILETRAKLAVGEAQHAHLVRVAQAAIAQHVPERAVAAIEQVLSEDPSNYESRDIAEELLLIGSVKGRAAKALESVYESKDEIRDLVRVLGVRVESLRPHEGETLTDSEVNDRENERRELLRRIATLRDDRLHDDEGSFDVFAELSPLDPEDSDLRDRLIDSGRRLNRGAKVLEVLLESAKAADTPRVRAEILLQAVPVQTDLLADGVGAEGILNQILALRDDVPEAALNAARSLETLLQAKENFPELASNLRIQVDLEDDYERKVELLARIARLQSDVLGNSDAAIEAWEERLNENADDAEAMRNLTELYEKAQRYQDVARVLTRRREVTSDEKERGSLARHLADVQEQHLGDAANAIESFQAILDESGPNPEVLAALCRLYEKSERWEELAETYERQVDTLEGDNERLFALTALGRLRAQQLKDLPGALETYRRVLASDNAHQSSREAVSDLLTNEDAEVRLAAAQILEPIYEADGDHPELLTVVLVQAESSEDPAERIARYADALRIAEGALSDPDRAMQLAAIGARVAAGQGDLAPWVERLERLAEAASARALQVEVLSDIVGEIFDSELQMIVQRRIGELKRDVLGDRQGAIDAYRAALEFQSGDEKSLSALESLLSQSDDHEALLRVLESRLEAAESDDERKEIAYRRARLLSSALKDKDGAIEAYEQILDIELDPLAIRALESLYAESERFDDLSSLIQRRIDSAAGEGKATADLHVQLARVAALRQNDFERGLDELEHALSEDTQHESAVEFLEELGKTIEDPQLLGRLASILEPVYMIRADYEGVLRVLSLRLDGSEDPGERRELVARIAQIHEEQREDYLSALEVTARLLPDDLGDTEILGELERLAKVADAELRLAEIFSKQVKDLDSDDEASARLCRRAGMIFAAADRKSDALLFLKRALVLEPTDDELFSAVDTILKEQGDAQARVELYREALEHRYEPEEQQRLLAVIAQLEEGSLGNLEAAIEAHKRTIETDEENQESFDALARLYSKLENWSELAELYLRKAESLGSLDGAKVRILLADLYMRKLGEHEASLEQLEEIVREQPQHSGALERLEAMRASEDLRGRVVEILRPIYQAQDQWRKVIRLNEDRFELAQDPMDQVMILRETGDLWENRGDDFVRAIQAFISAWKLSPDDEELRGEVERISVITRDWDTLGVLYSDVLDKNPDMGSRRDVVARLAELYDTHLNDPRSALGRYMELSELDPTESEPIDATLRLSLLLGDWKARESALVRKAESVYDDRERSDYLMHLGELRLLTLTDIEGALSAYERAFEADESSSEICDRLIALYEERDEPERLAELYLARVDGGKASDELRFELLQRAAKLFEGPLSDASRAIDALGQALLCRSGDPDTIRELNRLYRSEERWPDLLDNLRLEAGTATTVQHRLAVRFGIAEILANKMQSPDEALEAYAAILDEKPDDEAALDAVFTLAEREEQLSRHAAELLVPALRQTNLRERLVRALGLRLSGEDDPQQRVETLRTMAHVQENDLGDKLGAFESFLLATKDAPEAADLYDEVERLSSSVNGWSRFAEVLRERAADAFDSEMSCRLWIRLARVEEDKLNNKEAAVSAYQSATEQVGDRLELLDVLDRLYTDLDDTASVVELLERRMSLAESDQDHARLLCRQAQLQLNKQKNPTDAISSLRQALERDLHSKAASQLLGGLLAKDDFFDEVFDILDSVYRDRPDGAALAELHGMRVKRAESPEDRLNMRRDLAQVLELDCKDDLAAQRVFQEALADDINDAGLRDEIERLCGRTGAWSEAGTALVNAVNLTKSIDAELARELCEQAAVWQRDKGRDPNEAEKSLLRALHYAPNSDEILLQLEGIQNAEGKEDALLSTLRKRARISGDEDQKLNLLRRCGVLAEKVGKSEVAEEILREILKVKGNDREALESLTKVRLHLEDYKEAHQLLEVRIGLEQSNINLRDLRFQAAEIARGHLGKVKEATAVLKELFDEDPSDARVATALRQAYVQGKRYDELGELINVLMATSNDPTVRADLKVGLAQLRFDQFKDIGKAVELLEEVIVSDPRHGEAGTVLAEVYEQSSRFGELAGLLRRRSELALEDGDEPSAIELLRHAASLLESKLKDLDQALLMWVKIRSMADSSEVRETILRLQLAADRKQEAALSLEEICEGLDGAEKLKRRTDLVEIYRALGDHASVVRTVEGSFALDPENGALRETLRSEYEAAGVWEKVAEMILMDADAAEGTTKVDLLREAASVHMQKRNDANAAATILDRAAELAPDDRALLLELCDAYSGSGRGASAAGVLEKVVEGFGGKRSKELGEIHRRLATAYLSQGEQVKAQEELDKAFRIEPGNVNILNQLGDVALTTGDMKKAQQMFRALLLQRLDATSPITKAQVFCRLGQVHQQLGEAPKAKQMYERALQADPQLSEAQAGLASL